MLATGDMYVIILSQLAEHWIARKLLTVFDYRERHLRGGLCRLPGRAARHKHRDDPPVAFDAGFVGARLTLHSACPRLYFSQRLGTPSLVAPKSGSAARGTRHGSGLRIRKLDSKGLAPSGFRRRKGSESLLAAFCQTPERPARPAQKGSGHYTSR